MFERFTADARAVVTGAQDEARGLNHRFIGTEHLLLALLALDGPVADLLHSDGVDYVTVRAVVADRTGPPHKPGADPEDEDAAALRAIGIDLDAVRAAIEENFGAGALRLPPPAPKKRGLFARDNTARFSDRAKKSIELSLREAVRLHHKFIAPEHLALGLIREPHGLAAVILTDKGVDLDALRSCLATTLSSQAA